MSTKIRGILCSILTAVAVGMHAVARTIVVPTQPVSPCDAPVVQSGGEAE